MEPSWPMAKQALERPASASLQQVLERWSHMFSYFFRLWNWYMWENYSIFMYFYSTHMILSLFHCPFGISFCAFAASRSPSSQQFRCVARCQTHSLLHQSSKGEEAGLLPRLVASLPLSKKRLSQVSCEIPGDTSVGEWVDFNGFYSPIYWRCFHTHKPGFRGILFPLRSLFPWPLEDSCFCTRWTHLSGLPRQWHRPDDLSEETSDN